MPLTRGPAGAPTMIPDPYTTQQNQALPSPFVIGQPPQMIPYDPVGRMTPRPLDELKQILGLFGITGGGKGSIQSRPDVDTGLVSGPQPTISTGPVIGDDILQQQINAARAGIAQSTAGAQQRLAEQMGARGLDVSPALLAMQAQLGSRGLGQQTSAERELRLGAAERNAGHVLQAQRALAEANEAAFGNRQREQIERQRIAMSPFQGLFSSILQSVLSGGLG